jgi:hypothetical protein
MKKVCELILSGNRISQNDAFTFIAEYLNIQNKLFTNKDISDILQLIELGVFDLMYAVKEYCRLKKYTIYHLSNKGVLLKVWIE